MPNLFFSFDPSNFYDSNIERLYNFEDCNIHSTDNYKLLKAEAVIDKENSILFLLVNEDGKHLSILRLVETLIFDSRYFQIKKSYSPVRGNGYGYHLYILVIEHVSTSIISDSFNTLPGSYNVWQKLLLNNNYDVRVLNTQTGKIAKIKQPLDDLTIWGVVPDYLEEIENTQWDAVIFEDEFIPVNEDDFYDEEYHVNYLTENDKYDRTMVSDWVVRALKQGKSKIKDRKNIVLVITKKQKLNNEITTY